MHAVCYQLPFILTSLIHVDLINVVYLTPCIFNRPTLRYTLNDVNDVELTFTDCRKTFSKFYRRYYDLISKFQVGLKSLLRQGLSEPDFYVDLVYKLKKIVGSNNFSAQSIKIISHYKKKLAITLMYCNRLHAW